MSPGKIKTPVGKRWGGFYWFAVFKPPLLFFSASIDCVKVGVRAPDVNDSIGNNGRGENSVACEVLPFLSPCFSIYSIQVGVKAPEINRPVCDSRRRHN